MWIQLHQQECSCPGNFLQEGREELTQQLCRSQHKSLEAVMFNKASIASVAFSWHFIGNEDKNSSVAIMKNSDYMDSPNGLLEWGQLETVERVTWGINTDKNSHIKWDVDVVTTTCDEIDNCACFYFAIFQLTSKGALREAIRTCGQSSQGKLEGISGRVVVLAFMLSISILLDFLFDSNVPNYELSKKWGETYGRFITCTHPFKNIIFANITDLEISKRIMSASAWSDRIRNDHYVYTWSFGKPLGILFGNGGYWKEARKLTTKLLHQLDFYKQENVENFISFEMRELEEEMLEAVKNGGGRATIAMHHKFQVYTLNIVYQVMLGKRFARDDPVAKKMLTLINAFNREFNLGTSILELFPWLLRVPFVKIMDNFHVLNDFLNDYLKRELLEPKRKAKSYAENPVDFVDYFLLEIDRRADETPRYLTDENLLTTLRDLIFAGADTTNSSLAYGILHMALDQLIQRKVQDEIDQIIGTRQPRYDDRLNMPYTQAVLQEVLRIASSIPVTARCPVSDNEINGEHMPKGSYMAINLYAIHRDPALWKNPEDFQPERFLSENNELVNLDKILPFGWGKRVCVGETVAQISLFLFFVMLMRTFSFEISQDHPPPSMKNQIGLSRAPLPYYVTVSSRNLK